MHHRLTPAEAGAALGLFAEEVTAAATRLGIAPGRRPGRKAGDPLLVLPYPGGRHPPCPCLHADPVVEDCPPGESRAVRGWLSFYAGTDIDAELTRPKPIAFP